MTIATKQADLSNEKLDDAALVARLKAGDTTACQVCVEAHSDGLYRLAFRMLRDEAAAEDIVQETFFNAWKSLERFNGRSRLGTWLFRIAYNNALMHLRSRKPAEPMFEDLDSEFAPPPSSVVPWADTPEQIVENGEIAQVLEDAIAAIPETLGVVFQLRDVEGRSTAETAEILGLTEGTVKVRLHRARLALRERLGGYFGQSVPSESAQLTCEQVVKYISDYIDAELDEPFAAAVQEHLATCHHCHVVLDTTENAIVLFRGGDKRVIPAADRARLFGQIGASFAARRRAV